MSTSEKPKGIKAFKKSALVVLATTHAAKNRSSTPKIKRQKSKEANAIDVLHTFVASIARIPQEGTALAGIMTASMACISCYATRRYYWHSVST
jgi:hypothetical protein